MEINIDLNEHITDNFTGIVSEILSLTVQEVVMKGGRGGIKSQVAANTILTGTMLHGRSAVCFVKHANKIEGRLVNTFKFAIELMGLEKYWKIRKSPFELVLLNNEGKESNISIQFYGYDDPSSLKSIKPRTGSYWCAWFEELDNCPNKVEIDSILSTVNRGQGDRVILYTYNPPKRSSNWVNKEFDVPIGKVLGHDTNMIKMEYVTELNGKELKKTRIVHHSTYLDVVKSGKGHWLGDDFLVNAEQKKEINNKEYRWELLGEVIGTDANIFSNIRDWDGNIPDNLKTNYRRGLDHGYGGPDPTAYVTWAYDKRNNSLYAIDEFGSPDMSLDTLATKLKEHNKFNSLVRADSGVPMLNTNLASRGLKVIPAKKGPGSVEAGIKWLQGLNAIYINKVNTPNIYREFTQYEYKVNKWDEITTNLPDDNDHWIDATRYAMQDDIKYN